MLQFGVVKQSFRSPSQHFNPPPPHTPTISPFPIPPALPFPVENRDMCPQGGKMPGASPQSHDASWGDIVTLAS